VESVAPIVDSAPLGLGTKRLADAEPTVVPAWDAYVEDHPRANLYHLSAWKTVGERAYRLKTPFLVTRDRPGGEIRGVLPLFRVPRPFSSYLTTGLFGAYGHVLADDDRHGLALLREACRRVDAGEVDFLHVKALGALPPGTPLARGDHWVTALLDLEPRVDALFGRLSRNMRWSVRHAERAGLTVARGVCQLDAFYDVLSENMLRKGSPIYGRAFFHELARALGPRADVITLQHEGRTVSGALVASFKGVVYVPFASSRPAVFPLRANNLLFWEIAKHGVETGHHTLDFGSSLRDSSGLEFKRGWHPRIEPIGSYVHARGGVTPALLPTNSFVARNTVRLWSRLTPRVAEALGPLASRWIA
jgi:serine/alanine adding enzyme